MKARLEYAISVFLVLIFGGCNSSLKDPPNNIIGNSILFDINISPLSAKKIELSKIATRIDYIPLEYNDEAIIGSIDKIIFCDSIIFISDIELTETIYCFSIKGKYLFKISNKGKGPNEYLKLCDFSIDPIQKRVILFDESGNKILYYNFKGDIIKSLKVGIYAFKIEYIGGERIFCYAGHLPNPSYFRKEGFSFFTLNNNNKIDGKFMRFDPKDNLFLNTPIITNNFSENNGSYYLYKTGDNVIYQIDSVGINPIININFGEFAITTDFIKETDLRRQKELRDDGKIIIGLECFDFVGDWLLLSYVFQRKVLFNATNIKNNQMYDFTQVTNDIDYFPVALTFPYFSFDNKLVCVIEPYIFQRLKPFINNLDIYKTIFKNVNERDNPVLQVITLK